MLARCRVFTFWSIRDGAERPGLGHGGRPRRAENLPDQCEPRRCRGAADAGRTAPTAAGPYPLLAIGDLVSLVVAYALAYVVADPIAPLPPVAADRWFLVLVAVTAPVVWLGDLHRLQPLRQRQPSDQRLELRRGPRSLPRHARRVTGLPARVAGVDFFFDWWIYTAVESALFLGRALLLVPVVRGSIRSWVFPRVMTARRTLIVGSGDDARLVYRKIMAHPEYGLEIVGFLDGDADDAAAGADARARRPRSRRVVDEHEIDRVLLASSVGSHEETLDLVRSVRRPDVQVSIVPRYFEIFTRHATLDDVEGMPVVTLPPMRLGRSSRLLKRTVDVVVAALRSSSSRRSWPRSPLRSGWTARARRSTSSRAEADSDRLSTSSSSVRCRSVPNNGGARSCT